MFEGHNLQLSEETIERAPPGGKTIPAKAPATRMQTSLLVPRTAGSRPRAGVGKPRATVAGSSGSFSAPSFVAAASSAEGEPTKKGQDDFRKMLLKG